MFNIVLVHPRIPQNVGAIGRLCVNAGFHLHIIKPTLVDLSEKMVKRAGLDYWKKVNLQIWENENEFLIANSSYQDHFFFATTKTDRLYTEAKFQPWDFLFFGSETYGLPEIFMSRTDKLITIPMKKEGRSLNLAMSVAIVGYEAIRQNMSSFGE